MRRFGVAVLLAVTGGALLAWSFPQSPPLPQTWALRLLAVTGPLLLALAVDGLRARTAYLVAFVFGLAFFVPHIAWAGTYVGWLPWFALAAYQAFFVGFLGPALVALRRLPAWPVWAAFAWVADEAARSRIFFGGFPWGRLGFSQDAGAFTPYAAIGGVPLLSGAVALCGFVLAAAVLAARAPAGRGRALRLVALAALVPLLGGALWFAVPAGKGEPTATVAVIQGNVPEPGLEFNARRRAVLDNHAKETTKLAADIAAGKAKQPVLVIWPENSSDIDPYLNADAAEVIQNAADTIKAPILVGAVVSGPGVNVRNMAIMWWPTGDGQAGPGQTYVKRHPAPFAEYIPLRSFFRQITSLVDEVRADFVPGDRVGVFRVDRGPLAARPLVFGDVICFEVAYDDLVADTIDGGAQFLVVQTNNATFGYTNESYQQLAMSRIRAVETGRSVLSASTSGVSGVILPDGTVRAESSLFTAARYSLAVPLRTELTLASRLREIPEWTMTALAVLAIGWGIARGRRTDRSVPSTAPNQDDRPARTQETAVP